MLCCLSIYLSIYLSICLSIYLSIRLSVLSKDRERERTTIGNVDLETWISSCVRFVNQLCKNSKPAYLACGLWSATPMKSCPHRHAKFCHNWSVGYPPVCSWQKVYWTLGVWSTREITILSERHSQNDIHHGKFCNNLSVAQANTSAAETLLTRFTTSASPTQSDWRLRACMNQWIYGYNMIQRMNGWLDDWTNGWVDESKTARECIAA